jgi:hypothetical protein
MSLDANAREYESSARTSSTHRKRNRWLGRDGQYARWPSSNGQSGAGLARAPGIKSAMGGRRTE